MKRIDRTGETNLSLLGDSMCITSYENNHNIIVEFENGYKVKTSYSHFLQGRVSHPYERRTYGIGFVGEGRFKACNNSTHSKAYRIWLSMFERCYGLKTNNKNKTYIDCVVCDEWHNFQNFAEWVEKNYYEIGGEKIHLDKDILIKGNKVYSPETCVFVPQRINNLFVKCDTKRGKYPIGVYYNKKDKVFVAQCNNDIQATTYIGSYSSVEEAHSSYKTFKENYIKIVAKSYKDKIPEKLYKAMYNYEVTND